MGRLEALSGADLAIVVNPNNPDGRHHRGEALRRLSVGMLVVDESFADPAPGESLVAEASDRHARALGRRFTALALRDTRSRWGSCTHEGRLMYSWRLAMAPPEVLDYVAAHEVAHLRHMDHSPRFWAAVAGLMPGYAIHRDWLRRHGADLMAWQFRDPAGD